MMNLVARLHIRTPVNFVKTIIRDEGNTHIRCSLPRVAGISDYETKECKKSCKITPNQVVHTPCQFIDHSPTQK